MRVLKPEHQHDIYDFENYEDDIKVFSSIMDNDDILQMYLKDVGRTKMLSHAEELALGKTIKEGKREEKEE